MYYFISKGCVLSRELITSTPVLTAPDFTRCCDNGEVLVRVGDVVPMMTRHWLPYILKRYDVRRCGWNIGESWFDIQCAAFRIFNIIRIDDGATDPTRDSFDWWTRHVPTNHGISIQHNLTLTHYIKPLPTIHIRQNRENVEKRAGLPPTGNVSERCWQARRVWNIEVESIFLSKGEEIKEQW